MISWNSYVTFFVDYYKKDNEGQQHQRFGQAFCNVYGIEDNELWNETNDVAAAQRISDYIDHTGKV